MSPDREVRRHDRRGRSPRRSSRACARARTSSTRSRSTRPSTTGCAHYPSWISARNLVQRGERRVGRGARHRRSQGRYELAAALVPAEGQAARHRPARRLRPHGGAVGRRRRASAWSRGARARARRLRVVLARARRRRRALLRRAAGSTRRCARASAAARSAPTRCRRVHPYVMLNWTSRRRDVLTLAHELGHGVHAALARPQGVLQPEHAADARRDRVGVRRGARVRPAARGDDRAPSRGCRCSPRRSRARSRRCSARSR